MAESFRSMWKGYLRLSLVTIPVRMVTATRTDSAVRFNQLHKKTKKRIHYQKVAEGVGPVEKDDIVRGYEFEPGQYVVLSDEELDAVKLESQHTIELTQFVDSCEIDPLYFEKPYFLLPDGDVAEEGYRVIRDALRAMGKVGVGQQSIRGKENLVTIHPAGQGLLMEVLRYEEEVKEADAVFADIGSGKLRTDLVDMAKDLIERRSQPFDPDRFENHYAAALRDLVRRKIETGGHVRVEEKETGPSTVVDFMDALRRSLAKEEPQGTAAAEAESDGGKSRTARRGGSRKSTADKSQPGKPASGRRRKAGS